MIQSCQPKITPRYGLSYPGFAGDAKKKLPVMWI
jgi:hypothetical protein